MKLYYKEWIIKYKLTTLFHRKDKTLNNMNGVANEEEGGQKVDDFEDNNPSSVFLSETDENQIIVIVKKSKNRMSTDCHDIDMVLIKDIIDNIV